MGTVLQPAAAEWERKGKEGPGSDWRYAVREWEAQTRAAIREVAVVC